MNPFNCVTAKSGAEPTLAGQMSHQSSPKIWFSYSWWLLSSFHSYVIMYYLYCPRELCGSWTSGIYLCSRSVGIIKDQISWAPNKKTHARVILFLLINTTWAKHMTKIWEFERYFAIPIYKKSSNDYWRFIFQSRELWA